MAFSKEDDLESLYASLAEVTVAIVHYLLNTEYQGEFKG